MLFLNTLKFFSFLMTIFGWQHLGRVYDITHRPSYYITQLAELCEFCWTKLGNFLAYLGSYYHYLVYYSQEIVVSVMELMTAVFRCLASYTFLFVGFWETARSYANPQLVLFGSMLLTSLIICYLIWYYNIDVVRFLKKFQVGQTNTPPLTPRLNNGKNHNHQKGLNRSFPIDDDGNVIANRR
jgi:hypothetical protein